MGTNFIDRFEDEDIKITCRYAGERVEAHFTYLGHQDFVVVIDSPRRFAGLEAESAHLPYFAAGKVGPYVNSTTNQISDYCKQRAAELSTDLVKVCVAIETSRQEYVDAYSSIVSEIVHSPEFARGINDLGSVIPQEILKRRMEAGEITQDGMFLELENRSRLGRYFAEKLGVGIPRKTVAQLVEKFRLGAGLFGNEGVDY